MTQLTNEQFYFNETVNKPQSGNRLKNIKTAKKIQLRYNAFIQKILLKSTFVKQRRIIHMTWVPVTEYICQRWPWIY